MIKVGPRTVLAKTCIKCGRLCQGSEFYRMKRPYGGGFSTGSRCKRCSHQRVFDINKANREEAKAKATRHRKPWDQAEIRRLYELKDAGWTNHEVALELSRTIQAIEHAQERYPRKT